MNRWIRNAPLLVMIFCILFSGCAPETETPPSIILIYADDLGWSDLSVMGSTYYETPNIDRLAEEGLRFTRAYSNAPNCAPSRAALLTGQYAPRHGVYTVGSSERGRTENRKLIPVVNRTSLPANTTTIADMLQTAGYRTGTIGKWHLGVDTNSAANSGFDWSMAGSAVGHPASYFYPYERGNSRVPDVGSGGTEGEYLTDRITDEALDFIRESANGPYFLYLSHYAVHTPIQAKEEKIEHYKTKAPAGGQSNPEYAAMIESLDESVGRVVALVDSLGQSENTLILFYSDNGGHGAVTSMAPLRGAKGMLYEGGIRVPMLARWPGEIEPNSTTDSPVIGLDLFPTFLELAGAESKGAYQIDGTSIVSTLRGSPANSERPLFWHFPAYLEATRNSPEIWRTTPASVIQKGPHKLIYFFEDQQVELYDVEADISERTNLADVDPSLADSLENELREWWRETNAFVPAEPNPDYVDRSE